QVVGQDAPQPRGLLSADLGAETRPGLVGFEQGLLHHAGQVDLALQPRVELKAGQQAEVGPVALQRLVRTLAFGVHVRSRTEVGRRRTGKDIVRKGAGVTACPDSPLQTAPALPASAPAACGRWLTARGPRATGGRSRPRKS